LGGATAHGQFDIGGQGLGKPACVHDVGEHPVLTGWCGRQLLLKSPRADAVGMQVQDGIGGRHPHHEEVHEVSVIGQQIIDALQSRAAP